MNFRVGLDRRLEVAFGLVDRRTDISIKRANLARHRICAGLARLAEELNPPPAREDFELMTWAAIERGRGLSAASLFAATRDAARLSYALARCFERFDAIITPMLAAAPPLVGALPTDGDDIDRHFARMSALAPYAALANAAGLPPISVPQGLDTAGLPRAIQILGPMGSDILLLQLARFFELSAPWPFPLHRCSQSDNGRGQGDR